MTKKHFIALANVLKASEPIGKREGYSEQYENGRHVQWCWMVECIAGLCEQENPRFNRQRWLDYIAGECGPNGGKLK